jgi:hypothetical protein
VGGGLWGNVQDGVEDSVGGDCVFVIKVIVGNSYFVDTEPSYDVQVWAFLMEL